MAAEIAGNAIREALEPCPFCGDKHPHIEVVDAHSHGPIASFMPDHPGSAFVSCTNCEAMMTEVSEVAVIAAWNRRARTAYDAIGSEAGVKTDSGWVEWTGGETPVEPGTEGLIRVEDGEVIYTKQLGSFNFAHDRSGPVPGRRIVSYRVLSTHTAAGAGPVGEAVAWQWRSKLGPDGWSNASISMNDPGDLHEQFEKRPLYARPVEEPGEVERDVWQTLDTAPALAFEDHETDPVAVLLCNSEEEPCIGYVQTRRDGTRRGMVGMAHGIVWTHWAPLPARAALTGDAQEAGR